MERIKETFLATALFVGLLVGFGSSSEAAPYFAIQITTNAGSFVIQDNLTSGLGDADSRYGIIEWKGNAGNWTLDINVAQTYDYFGSISSPKIGLASVVNNSMAPDTLRIDVSVMEFMAPTTSFNSAQVAIGGTTLPAGNSIVSAQLFGGNSNVLFDKSNFIVSTGALAGDDNGGTFGGSAVANFQPTSTTFSLTSEVTILHNVQGTTTFDAIATAVPEPFTLLFLGTCLLGAGVASRKIKTKM